MKKLHDNVVYCSYRLKYKQLKILKTQLCILLNILYIYYMLFKILYCQPYHILKTEYTIFLSLAHTYAITIVLV